MATLSMSQLWKLFPCLTSSSGKLGRLLIFSEKKTVLRPKLKFINIYEKLSEKLFVEKWKRVMANPPGFLIANHKLFSCLNIPIKLFKFFSRFLCSFNKSYANYFNEKIYKTRKIVTATEKNIPAMVIMHRMALKSVINVCLSLHAAQMLISLIL